MRTKVCTACALEKSESEFAVADKSSGRLRGDCKLCVIVKWKIRYEANKEQMLADNTKARRKYTYGLTDEDYRNLLEAQNFECAICTTNITYATGHIDHDHSCCTTRKTCGRCVRGVLCKMCNTGLGHFQDKIRVLTNAIQYLELYQ